LRFAAQVAFDPNAKLTLEVSDAVKPTQLYAATGIEFAGDAVRVALTPRPAGCKPRARWLEQHPASKAAACCSPTQAAPCCN